MLYASFLQKFMTLVKDGLPAALRGPSSFSFSFGFHLLGFGAVFGLLGILSTSIGSDEAGLFFVGYESFWELEMSSLGISLWRILAFFALKSSCMVVNSHNRLTSPKEN